MNEPSAAAQWFSAAGVRCAHARAPRAHATNSRGGCTCPAYLVQPLRQPNLARRVRCARSGRVRGQTAPGAQRQSFPHFSQSRRSLITAGQMQTKTIKYYKCTFCVSSGGQSFLPTIIMEEHARCFTLIGVSRKNWLVVVVVVVIITSDKDRGRET